jgi:hypothetical protein
MKVRLKGGNPRSPGCDDQSVDQKDYDTLTRTCWRLRCCINRIPSDPGADL